MARFGVVYGKANGQDAMAIGSSCFNSDGSTPSQGESIEQMHNESELSVAVFVQHDCCCFADDVLQQQQSFFVAEHLQLGANSPVLQQQRENADAGNASVIQVMATVKIRSAFMLK